MICGVDNYNYLHGILALRYPTEYEYSKDYLLKNGIKPSFVKIIDNVTTYKYTKTTELFRLLSLFYK